MQSLQVSTVKSLAAARRRRQMSAVARQSIRRLKGSDFLLQRFRTLLSWTYDPPAAEEARWWRSKVTSVQTESFASSTVECFAAGQLMAPRKTRSWFESKPSLVSKFCKHTIGHPPVVFEGVETGSGSPHSLWAFDSWMSLDVFV
jgi:hypothetical protein